MKKFRNPVSFLWMGYVAFILGIIVITMGSCKKYECEFTFFFEWRSAKRLDHIWPNRKR